MKKILIALTVFVGVMHAQVVLGTEVSISKANGDVTASYMGVSASQGYTDVMKAVTVIGGYEFDQVRLLGYYSIENYSGSGASKSYGAEVDYLIKSNDKTDLLIGLELGKGELDASGLDFGFRDTGFKVGVITDLGEALGLEVGVKYKFRKFDSINNGGVNIEADEKQVGIYLGIDFSL